jgi:hypothetical protein
MRWLDLLRGVIQHSDMLFMNVVFTVLWRGRGVNGMRFGVCWFVVVCCKYFIIRNGFELYEFKVKEDTKV